MIPSPGDLLMFQKMKEKEKIVANRVNERKLMVSVPTKKQFLLNFFGSTVSEDAAEQKVLNLIVRADVLGSYEAIKQSLTSRQTPRLKLKLLVVALEQ